LCGRCLGFDKVGIFTGIQALIELLGIQIKLSRELFQVVFVESPFVFSGLVIEEVIVIFPKSILVSGTFAGFCCPLRFGSQESEMPVSETNFTSLDVIFIDLTPRVSGKSAAEWSLVVAEFDHGDRGIRVSFEMVGLSDKKFHQRGCASW
jgi:hypothetical protein